MALLHGIGIRNYLHRNPPELNIGDRREIITFFDYQP